MEIVLRIRSILAAILTAKLVTRWIFLWPFLILMGAILTLATVLVGDSVRGYGFPFPWKTAGCPPPGIEISASCFLAIGYDWLSFGLDVLLFTFAGYGLMLAYTKYRARRRARLEVGRV